MTRRPANARWILRAVTGAGVALLAGCASLQGDRPAATPTQPAEVRVPANLAHGTADWPASDWWQRFDDPQLDGLIERGLRDAPSMRAVAARSREAAEGVDKVRALTGLTSVGIAALNRQWSKATGDVLDVPLDINLPFLGNLSAPVTSTTSVAGVVGMYRLDLWGGERAAVDAALGARAAQRAEAAAARLALSAAIAQTYFGLQTANARVALLERMLAIQRESVAAGRARKVRGLVTDTAIAVPRTQAILTEQLLAAAQAQATATSAALHALVGARADEGFRVAPAAAGTAAVALPKDLPFDLLARRPDLVALRVAVEASYNQIAIAKAAFYPQFNLLGFIGAGHIDLRDLELTRRQFNLVPGVTLPIFNLGLLRANLRSAREGSNALVEQYNQAVLNAVRDVTTAASGLAAADRQEQLQVAKIAQARIGKDDADARARRGLVSRVHAAAAGLPALQEELLLADARGAARIAAVTLIAALGGGYDNAATGAAAGSRDASSPGPSNPGTPTPAAAASGPP